MATTAAPWSMPYPLGTDRVMDGDDVIHALADRVHLKLTESLSGVPATAAGTFGSGWSGGAIACTMRSGWIHVNFFCVKGSSWVMDETIGNIPAGYRPAINSYVAAFHSGTGLQVMCGILTTGVIQVRAAYGSGAAVLGVISYPVP